MCCGCTLLYGIYSSLVAVRWVRNVEDGVESIEFNRIISYIDYGGMLL